MSNLSRKSQGISKGPACGKHGGYFGIFQYQFEVTDQKNANGTLMNDWSHSWPTLGNEQPGLIRGVTSGGVDQM